MITKTYQIEFNKRFIKDLEKIPRIYRKAIQAKISALAHDPRPEGCKKLQGNSTPYYRVRCGDYRIVYTINDGLLLIVLIEIGHRSDIYR